MKVKNFFDEILQCLIARRDEWTINGSALLHKSGVKIIDLSFDPPIELTDDEKTRLKTIVEGVRRQYIMEQLDVATIVNIEQRVDSENLSQSKESPCPFFKKYLP